MGLVWGTINSLNHKNGHQFHSARPKLSIIWANSCHSISVRQHSWAYPQHLKVLKHFVYMLCESGMSLGGALLIVSTMEMGIISTQPDPIFWLTDKTSKFWHMAEREVGGIFSIFWHKHYKCIHEQSLKKIILSEQNFFLTNKIGIPLEKNVFLLKSDMKK